MNSAVTELELHAFIDNELPPARMAEVEAAIAADPALAARVHGFQDDMRALRAAFAPMDSAPIPSHLLRAAKGQSQGNVRAAGRPTRRHVIVAGAAAALAAGIALALLPLRSRETAVDQAIAARDNKLGPSRLLDGHDQSSLALAGAAISDLFGSKGSVPDLAKAGFQLVAADVFSGAVQLRYEDQQRRLFTIFLQPSMGPDMFQVTERGTVRICVWQNADVTAVMTGEMPTPELFRLASLSYVSLGL